MFGPYPFSFQTCHKAIGSASYQVGRCEAVNHVVPVTPTPPQLVDDTVGCVYAALGVFAAVYITATGQVAITVITAQLPTAGISVHHTCNESTTSPSASHTTTEHVWNTIYQKIQMDLTNFVTAGSNVIQITLQPNAAINATYLHTALAGGQPIGVGVGVLKLIGFAANDTSTPIAIRIIPVEVDIHSYNTADNPNRLTIRVTMSSDATANFINAHPDNAALNVATVTGVLSYHLILFRPS